MATATGRRTGLHSRPNWASSTPAPGPIGPRPTARSSDSTAPSSTNGPISACGAQRLLGPRGLTASSIPTTIIGITRLSEGHLSAESTTWMVVTAREGRSGVAVFVVPVPPRVRWGLRVALGRVLPVLLTSERGQVEVAPGAPHRFVATIVDEVGAVHIVVVPDERVRPVPFVHAEVGVEAVGHGVPGHLPVHPR